MTNRRSLGFTLAEVLITLGIIGVVAAMTMPTLINQTNGAQYKAAYKKALSAIAQGITLNYALDDKDFSDAGVGVAGATTKEDSTAYFLNERMNIVNAATASGSGYESSDLKSYFTEVKAEYEYTCTSADVADSDNSACSTAGDTVSESPTVTPDTFLFFNDSSMFAIDSNNKQCTHASACAGIIDVNGLKGPNKFSECDSSSSTTTCTVSSPKDIYPVVYFDQTILPGTDAAKAVLYGK